MLDAITKTRLFLFPFESRRYAAVAVVTAFIGVRAGYGSVTNLVALFLFDGGVGATEPLAFAVADSSDFFLIGAVAVTVAAFVSAVAEFVLIDVFRTDEARPRQYARGRLGDGFRLFIFRTAATAVLVLAAAGVPPLMGRASETVVLTAVVAVLVFGVLVSVVNGFTTDFVAPIMVVRGCSLLEGWRSFWGVLVREPVAFVGYAVARSAANLLVAVGATVAAVAVAAFYALPIAGMSLALGLTAEGQGLSPETLLTTLTGFVLLAVVVVLYVALVAASVAALVQLPVRLFFRSWALYFLGDVAEEYETLEKPKRGGSNL